MLHKDVLNEFKEKFPNIFKETIEWFPNGKNSVRLKNNSNMQYAFTYNGPTDWRFETLQSFIDSMNIK